MPYIPFDRRVEINKGYSPPLTAGELNYKLTQVLAEYLEASELSYGLINDVIGALEGCKLEFYRRVAVPFEEKKCRTNGDVY